MSDKVIAVLPDIAQGLLSNGLPDWVEPRFFMSKDEAMALATEAEIGWFDMYDKGDMALTISRATRMKWLNSVYAGVDGMPLELLAERGVTVTNGAGINAITIAEYVIMGMLTVAKGYRDVVHIAPGFEMVVGDVRHEQADPMNTRRSWSSICSSVSRACGVCSLALSSAFSAGVISAIARRAIAEGTCRNRDSINARACSGVRLPV